jgi:hypothetical protein
MCGSWCMLPTCDRTEYFLECIVEDEGLDEVLNSLIAIAEKKAQSEQNHKLIAKQCSRASRRLNELREWCAEFGLGSRLGGDPPPSMPLWSLTGASVQGLNERQLRG